MIRGCITILTFISSILFPWPLAALLALSVSVVEPLVPLAAGIFLDTLYYVPHTSALPVGTLSGAVATTVAFFVRSRLKTSIIGG